MLGARDIYRAFFRLSGSSVFSFFLFFRPCRHRRATPRGPRRRPVDPLKAHWQPKMVITFRTTFALSQFLPSECMRISERTTTLCISATG